MAERDPRPTWRRALGVLLPRHRGARIAVIAVVVFVLLALLDPFLSLLGRGVDLVRWLGTPSGRFVGGNAALVAGFLVLRRRIVERMRIAREAASIAMLVRGFGALAQGRSSRAVDLARRILRQRSTPSRVPWLRAQAELLAIRAELASGTTRHPFPAVDEAPVELRRSAAQLRVASARRQAWDRGLVRTAIDEGLAAFPDDVVLLRHRVEFLDEDGDHDGARAAQARVADAAPPAERANERRKLAAAWAAAGHRLLQAEPSDAAGAGAMARRALAVDPQHPDAHGLLGDIALLRADHGAAIRAFATAGDESGWSRVLALLDDPSMRLGIADLLDAVPHEAALALLARESILRGKAAFAERAARVLQRRVGPTPAANALLDLARRLDEAGPTMARARASG
ncbi:MAG: hypothetical protein U1F36_07345 [Planctomycetota bacterium]